MKKKTSIFKQLILNVIIPVVMALLILATLNYYRTKEILVQGSSDKNYVISDEIKNILEFQDLALGLVESRLDRTLRNYSDRLVNIYFADTKNIETANLKKIQQDLGMDSQLEDIYILNSQGEVVNTTFEKDLHRNFFSFGEQFKTFLLGVLTGNKFVSEKFSIETTTKNLRKYTYQPTDDGKYIIEIGNYSKEANNIIQVIKDRLNNISNKQKSIVSVDLFIGDDNPFSLNNEATINEKDKSILIDIFTRKDSRKFFEDRNNKNLHFDYSYMERKNTELYKGSVIRIISDRSNEDALLKAELLKSIVISGLTILAVIMMIYLKTRVITKPIKKLVANVNRIKEGDMNQRAEVEGNNEIASLSEHFNSMLERLEEYYNELEQKVIERTAKISHQKEEIELQRDSLSSKNTQLKFAYDEIEEQKKQITDSIHYARRIQDAILPADAYINRVLPDSFVLYKPKDIVSGDFYWVNDKDDKVIVAVVDCTGHGVPGAFMSIVGNNNLNIAVNVTGARKPSMILDALNEGVTKSLRQKEGVSGVKDGMDIALCSFDFKNNKLEFAAAFNPIFHVRDNILTQYDADKFPIGAFMDEELKKFKNNEIDLIKGDVIYIFSDGYKDQFGGKDDKKFMVKKFKILLAEISNLPMQEQKSILDKTIVDWMSNTVQVDDILVVGVRV